MNKDVGNKIYVSSATVRISIFIVFFFLYQVWKTWF